MKFQKQHSLYLQVWLQPKYRISKKLKFLSRVVFKNLFVHDILPDLSIYLLHVQCIIWGCHGRDHMVVGFSSTCAFSAYRHFRCEFEPSSWQGVLHITLCDKVCQ